MLSRRFAMPGYRTRFQLTDLAALRAGVGCDLERVPPHVVVIGWNEPRQEWLVHLGTARQIRYRLPVVLRFVDHRMRPLLPRRSFWFPICLEDGWDEAGTGDEAWGGCEPQPLGCFSARTGTPHAVLLPESHYLERFHYVRFRLEARLDRRPLSRRAPSAIFCGGPHGRPLTAEAADRNAPSARVRLRELAEQESLPVDVHLGSGVSRRAQRRHRMILDVDGWVRTFDAWAWKLFSGSLLLSQATPWETFFTREFEAWTHFVPVAEDFHDLAERLAWCESNDSECTAIAARARRRAFDAYDIDRVTERAAAAFRDLVRM